MAAAWEVPTHPTLDGRYCIGTHCRDHSGTHRKPYSADAEFGAGWLSQLVPAKTSHKQVAA